MGEAADWHRDAAEAEENALHAELTAWAARRAARQAQQPTEPREGADIPTPRMVRTEPASRRREPAAASSDTDQIVQVRMAGAPRAYGYTWPATEEPLELHDWVMLPGNVVSPEGCKGRVEGFGRDGYTGPLKAVVSRIERPDPWEARMEAVTTPAEARRVFAAAKREGLDAQKLAKLQVTGRKKLSGSATLSAATKGGAQ